MCHPALITACVETACLDPWATSLRASTTRSLGPADAPIEATRSRSRTRPATTWRAGAPRAPAGRSGGGAHTAPAGQPPGGPRSRARSAGG
jgi:hypothetical protein